jgi:hypothetical protein
MDKRNQFEKLQDVAESLGWSYQDNAEEIVLSRYTSFGQDYSFELDTTEDLLEQVYYRWQDFDPCSEAMIWLDSCGHGKNGAPDYMGDVLKDMEEIDSELEKLYITFLDA